MQSASYIRTRIAYHKAALANMPPEKVEARRALLAHQEARLVAILDKRREAKAVRAALRRAAKDPLVEVEETLEAEGLDSDE